MKKKLASIVLSVCLALSLLPTAALAEGETNRIQIGQVTLESGGIYVPASAATAPSGEGPAASIRVVDKVTAAPTDGGYLTCDGTTVTVHGAVTLPDATASGIIVSGAVTLNAGTEGTDSLSFTSNSGPAITVNAGGTLTLTGGGNLTLDGTSAPAISGGGSLTTSGYTGDITVTSGANAIVNLASVTLETTGTVRISTTGANSNAITTGGDVTLKGSSVSLGNRSGMLCAARNLSITSEAALNLTGASDSPLFPMVENGTLTFASDSAVTVTNTSGIAVGGNLMATAKTVTITGTGSGQAVSGNATITAEDAVTIKNEPKDSTGSSAITGNLTVTAATDVTVTGSSGTPAIAGAADITASGPVAITNSAGMAVGSALTVTDASTVKITGNMAGPVVAGTIFNNCGSVTITNTDAAGVTNATAVIGNTPAKMVINGTEMGVLFGSTLYADGGGKSGNGLRLDPAPKTATCYKAGSGWIFFTPAVTGDAPTPAKLVLEHAAMSRQIYVGVDEPITVQVNGINDLKELSAKGTITLIGNGTLNAADIETFSENGISIEDFAGTLNAVLCTTAFDVNENSRSTDNVVHGSAACPQGLLVGSLSRSGATESGVLNIPRDTTLTIRPDYFMTVRASENLTNNGSVLNNGTIELVVADPGDAAAVKAEIAKLGAVTGSGKILAISADYNHDGAEEEWTGSAADYTLDGVALHVLRSEGLDFTGTVTTPGVLDTDGYHWDAAANTLTLKNLALTESSTDEQTDKAAVIGIKLPGDAKLVLEGSSTISGFSTSIRQAGASAAKGSLTVSGTGSLTSDGLWTMDGNFTMDSGAVNMAIRQHDGMSSGITKGTGLTVAGDAAFRGGSWTGNIGIDAMGGISISGGTLRLSLTEGEGAGIIGVGNFTMTGGEVDVSTPENNIREDAMMGILMLGGVGLMGDSESEEAPPVDVSVSITGGKLRVHNTMAALLILTGSEKQITVNTAGMDVSTAPAGGTLRSFAMESVKGAAYATGTLTAANYQTACCTGLAITPASSSGGDHSGGSTATTTTTTTTNPDGSTTTKVTDSSTGTVTETTKAKDGTTTAVETKKDGTVTTTATNPAGEKTQTVKKADGSMTGTVTRPDGVKAESTTTAAGQTTASITVPEGKKDVTLVIPTPSKPSMGTVAVQTLPDGTRQVVKSSLPTDAGMQVTLDSSAAVTLQDNAKTFADVPDSFWGKDAVDFVSARELMNGITPNLFDPNGPMTRSMFWMLACRQYAENFQEGGDVWYQAAQSWMQAHGYSDGSNPNGALTRQDMITMRWRLAGSPRQTGDLSAYPDANQVSDYALQAMLWAVATKQIQGINGMLLPRDPATRGQLAAVTARQSMLF